MTRGASDLCKLTLIGYLSRDPEIKLTRHDKEFVRYSFIKPLCTIETYTTITSYTVSTKNFLPADGNGGKQSKVIRIFIDTYSLTRRTSSSYHDIPQDPLF